MHQEVTGFAHQHSNKAVKPKTMVVVAEGWPSWLLAVLATGLLPSQIYVKERSYQNYFAKALANKWRIVEEAKELYEVEVVFISGSEGFIKVWCSVHGQKNMVAVVEPGPARGKFPGGFELSWKRMAHARLGGVTTC